MPRYVRCDDSGKILAYGLMSTETLKKMANANIRVIIIDTLHKDMDQYYVVNENDDVVRKEV